MAMDCEGDEIMASGGSVAVAYCNPQEDSQHRNQAAEPLLSQAHVKPPVPVVATEDLPPWSQLEKMKKEANEVAMYSVPDDDQKAIITVISGSGSREDKEASSEVLESNKAPKSDKGVRDAKACNGNPPPAPSIQTCLTSFSEYTSFGMASSGYHYPIDSRSQSDGAATTSVSLSSKFNSHDSQEHSMENFNQFLELSSMTANSHDHAATMGQGGNHPSKESRGDVTDKEAGENTACPGLWPERLLRNPEMNDAPSGILLVFDRMLDCIDPKSRPEAGSPRDDEDYVCGYDTDQSSAWSLSVNRSWLLQEFGDLSTTGSVTTDDYSLSGSVLMPKAPTEWLGESLDCIFPCWNETPAGEEEELPFREPASSILELVEAVEAGRKRKWDLAEEEADLELEEEPSEVRYDASGEDRGNETDATRSSGSCEDGGGEDPFDFAAEFPPADIPPEDNSTEDFPSEEFPPAEFPPADSFPPGENEAESAPNLGASGSSLSELFEGLVFGTPSDESGEGEELWRLLDSTSATEETSTLSYSDGTV